jgi:hypothetical protein
MRLVLKSWPPTTKKLLNVIALVLSDNRRMARIRKAVVIKLTSAFDAIASKEMTQKL